MRNIWPRGYRLINGKRGEFLCLHAAIYLGIGTSYILIPRAPDQRQIFGWLPDFLTLEVLGWVWIIAAAAGILGAFIHKPPRADQVGFAVVTSVPLFWAGLFLISWLTGYTATGWIATIIYGGYAGTVMLVSSWPNPPPVNDLVLPPIPERQP